MEEEAGQSEAAVRLDTYTIAADGQSITCLICGLTSHNRNDVEMRYCGNCHRYHMDLPFLARLITARRSETLGEELILECGHIVFCAVSYQGERVPCSTCLHDYLRTFRQQ